MKMMTVSMAARTRPLDPIHRRTVRGALEELAQPCAVLRLTNGERKIAIESETSMDP